MSIQTTDNNTDVSDNTTRQLGQVGIVSSYQDEYLPLILNELRRVALLLQIATEEASFLASSTTSGVWTTRTASYGLTSVDTLTLGDATTAAITLTLPNAVGATQLFTIKKKDSSTNVVTVATSASQTIDGATTYPLIGQYQSITVASDDSTWYIV